MTVKTVPKSIIDIGFNFTNKRFEKDRGQILKRALSAGVSQCIITGTSIAESKAAIKLCSDWNKLHPGMLFSTVGTHPHDADSFNSTSSNELKKLALDNPESVVAIGETGLDFNRNYSAPKAQINAFERQIELASNLKLPLFLHERDAHQQQIILLKAHRDNFNNAVIHCFSGDKSSLYNYLDLDLHIGITGWLCDERRGKLLQTLVKEIPLDRLMIETDAPYLLPRTLSPKPKSNRNEPAYLYEILHTVATLRGEDPALIAEATKHNTQRFFHLPSKEGTAFSS